MIFTYFSRGMGVYYQSFTHNEFGVVRLDLRQSAHIVNWLCHSLTRLLEYGEIIQSSKQLSDLEVDSQVL